jgi:hypothetical protein
LLVHTNRFSLRPQRTSALSSVRPCLVASPQIPNVYAPIPTHKTIFHAFTQQNRMSSPQTHQKTNNPNSINKIKLSQK